MSETTGPDQATLALMEEARRRYRRGMRVVDVVTLSALALGIASLGVGALALPETALSGAGAIIAVSAVVARQIGGLVVAAILEARARAWLQREHDRLLAQSSGDGGGEGLSGGGPAEQPGPPASR